MASFPAVAVPQGSKLFKAMVYIIPNKANLNPHLSDFRWTRSLRQDMNSPQRLVRQNGISSSAERHATNKIYGAFLGSAFVTQMQAYIGDMIKPRAMDLWPFIHLLDEMQS
jgi:hypothetical protein